MEDPRASFRVDSARFARSTKTTNQIKKYEQTQNLNEPKIF